METVQLESMIICPACGHTQWETMAEDWCQIAYACPNCDKMLRPTPGDCCVFCSYGSVPCPPIQRERAGASAGDEQ